MPVNVCLLRSEALEIVKNKGYNESSASNGWLEIFIARHQIEFSNLHGESAGVDPKLCDHWKENLLGCVKVTTLKIFTTVAK